VVTQQCFTSSTEADLEICELRDCPQWLNTLAQWHHQAWGSGTLEQRVERLQKHLDETSVPTSFVAFHQQQPIASISLVHYQRLGEAVGSVWLANLFVDESRRCQGIANRLLDHAIGVAREWELSTLYLYATDQQAYYQKRGWQVRRRGEFRGQPAAVLYYSLTK
jgi:predicted N-acetyltransferase YhbS